MKIALYAVVTAAGLVSAAGIASAGPLVYQPTNPTFGGNPLNGSFLLSTAQTQGSGSNPASSRRRIFPA